MIRVCTLEMYPSEHARRTSTRQTWGISPWGTRKYIRGASLRGRLRPPATLAHKQEFNKMLMTGSHREVHGFRCKLLERLANAKSSMVPQQPGRRMYGRNRKDGDKEQCTGEPFAHHTTSIFFCRPSRFRFITHAPGATTARAAATGPVVSLPSLLYKALRSTGRFRRPLRSLTNKNSTKC